MDEEKIREEMSNSTSTRPARSDSLRAYKVACTSMPILINFPLNPTKCAVCAAHGLLCSPDAISMGRKVHDRLRRVLSRILKTHDRTVNHGKSYGASVTCAWSRVD
ncbi:hypothetical protein PUN28_004826 [Cardiocondyla obscurior]|uniref:Uncharacterized protein n=1 Tax=Cardiocondyla obscurior TaxID=286306 RepID=A0AAW2GCS2_9HYME